MIYDVLTRRFPHYGPIPGEHEHRIYVGRTGRGHLKDGHRIPHSDHIMVLLG